MQVLIHKLEVAGGLRHLKSALLVLAVVLLAVAYDFRDFKNFSTQEAMDSAQLGRNLAEGRGYTTRFLRPLSLHLVQQVNQKNSVARVAGVAADYAQIHGPHPDLANPPVYPVLLAGWMTVLPFDFTVSQSKAFWSNNGRFWRYQPDFLIAVLNQLLLLGVVVLAFFWAKRVFDVSVAWLASVLLFGTELLWKFSVSGLSTLLLMLMFLGLVWFLTLIESAGREPESRATGAVWWSVAAGVLVGLGGLTRYSFAWLILPVLGFLALFTGLRRVKLGALALAAFALVLTPWVVRNFLVSGTPFGLATYSAVSGTGRFPEFNLERSLEANPQFDLWMLWWKLIGNLRNILQNEFFGIGGGWITAFFLVGLLLNFRSPALRRMRVFTLLCLATLLVVQALGRTQLSVESPGVNSENLLVLLLPVVVVLGVGVFFVLLDQLHLAREFRRLALVLFAVVNCLPLIFALLPPRTIPLSYPPYLPSLVQTLGAWMREDDLLMSDVPWAVAWYGNRSCVWLTLEAVTNPNTPDKHESFYAINDFQKPINGLYLSPLILDQRFSSQWAHGGDTGWGTFVLGTVLRKQPPTGFPLHELAPSLLPDQIFLTDWKRWEKAP